jgi:hypothetical protein
MLDEVLPEQTTKKPLLMAMGVLTFSFLSSLQAVKRQCP